MMIKKVLIANRSEIALRIIKTCKKMGIRTVTVYSDDDRALPHAYRSDESYSLGQGGLAQTYLNQDQIIEIAKKSGADAIHPGYGFLSENAQFCEKVISAGLVFIGPTIEAISLMGDKKESKVKMEQIDAPVVPGYHGEDQSKERLKDEAQKIGFPVLIKATAGGGGKGMRIVLEAKEFDEALKAAKREAKNAFGNDQVLLEKYIIRPRHIEVQLVSDSHGQHYHFFERECSIQRRYQKIVEETPSVALNDSLRERICNAAVSIAKGINYLGAGTVEFILDQSGEFYFLEMNTRLQVEHPVTEMVTGFDLVQLQIEVASGEKFEFKQEDIKQKGHAIEVRLYAEDPDNEFLPTVGKIKHIGRSTLEGVRLDSGYDDNNEVSINYDPMIAKLIVHADDRDQALMKMNKSLNEILFSGIKTNRDYLKRVLNHEKFKSGDIHTHFIDECSESLEKSDYDDQTVADMIAVGVMVANKENTGLSSWDTLLNFRNV